jgi:metal iron transporter
MPHSLYVGSGIVQPRLREYDEKHGLVPKHGQPCVDEDDSDGKECYTPSLKAIRHSYRTSTLELGFTLFTFALFVNSAIVIVSGISLYKNPNAPDADLFSIHELLSKSVSSTAGVIFALSLLLSGVSAGIVCTISGQMVSEGALRWRIRPWLRRLVTRSISVIPSIIIAAAVGRTGLNNALNASQVVLSIVLPFVSAPLIYFTCRAKYMTVKHSVVAPSADDRSTGALAHDCSENPVQQTGSTSFANSWYTAIFAILVWLIILVLNVANLVLLGLGH